MDDAARLDDEIVVLLHGLGAGPVLLTLLARRLARRNYRTLNWSYPSILHSIEVHGQRLAETFERLDDDEAISTIHVVAHSMGCIVSRYALSLLRPAKLGRMVLLAPPNRGSRVASFFAPALGRLCRPIDQLADRPDSFVNQLDATRDIDIGIIAASWDLLVGVSSTRLEQEADHMVVPSWHSGMLLRRDVAEQVDAFLRSGRFERPADDEDRSKAA
jgi:pimeloyl-ACP methyl ester carboxylesterase